MKSKILRASTKVVSPLLMAYSAIVFLKGHNQPGGGFIGGLLLALGVVYLSLGRGKEKLKLPFSLETIIGVGALTMLTTVFISLIRGEPIMKATWWFSVPLPFLGDYKIGSIFVFDLGVYILVAGVVLKIILSISEEEDA